LSAQIAILNKRGIILETNRAWREFGMENDFPGDVGAQGLNYLAVCDQASGKGAAIANRAAQGIRSVMTGKTGEFTMEYLCDTPTQNMWFYMRVTRSDGVEPHFVVICHENVTPLKLAEEMIRKRERELALKTRNLEEVNTALRVLVEQREKDKRELEERVVSNVRQLVTRYIDKMKETHLNEHQRTLLGIIESHLKDVISPFLQKASALNIQLTPGEIHVATLVREGLTTKEIAGTLYISAHAVDFHRKNIRSKLGLNRKKSNLRSYLISLG
ncbi:MAG: LuxR C-terminal-related transcriptional regulator, partial [Desulfatirhabdiaceae bacterium]|nr:LuxR C-terminal-related transcriptional regulator [Desulfatirhabdiaceae bacterium]